MSMPSYWFDPFVGGSGGTLGGNAATGQPAMSSAQINAGMGWNPNAAQFNPFANSGGYFGAQPAAYAAAGAAYGRATGGFIPGGSRSMNAARMGTGGIGSDAARAPDDTPWGAPPQIAPPVDHPYPLGDSSWYPAQRTPQSAFSFDPASMGGTGGFIPGGSASMNRMRTGGANASYFNPGTYAGDQGNYGIPYNGAKQPGDIGFTPQSPMPNIGYNPAMQNSFANPAMGGGAFQGRFGMGFPNAGTPSQYAPGAQMPPGFLSPYSVDNPQGALPLGWSNSFNN
jgi:hypothetical protein